MSHFVQTETGLLINNVLAAFTVFDYFSRKFLVAFMPDNVVDSAGHLIPLLTPLYSAIHVTLGSLLLLSSQGTEYHSAPVLAAQM